MFRAWMHGAGFVLAAAAVLLFVLLLIVRRPKTRTRCPGEQRTYLDFLLPWRWLRIHSCGYDLTGVPRDAQDVVTCPECGRGVQSVGELVSSPWRGRFKRFAALLLLGSLIAYSAPWIRSGRWAQRLPTSVLILSDRLPYPIRPGACRRELDIRIDGGALSREQKRSLIPSLIADLHDDNELWNGMRAMRYLSEWKELSRPALHAALRSTDWQQRQLAADILRGDPGYPPSADLLTVTVEGLRDDQLPYEKPRPGRTYGTTSWVANATAGTYYLLRHPVGLAPFLRVGLQSDDHQQRELAAIVAAYAGYPELIHLAAPILIEGLVDNKIDEDARHAVAALHAFGTPIVPWLLPLRFSPDDQQRALALLILRELDLLPAGFGEPDPKVLGYVTEIVRLNDPCGIQTLARHWTNFDIFE